ncbi:hypothetical protein J2T09_000372 [Neorhizobium huautlense]|uniref:Lipoprotein n=1 Tax=Neorhizobium huautlense TaxID=67774 RepID=A0ABT9PMF3_9HYPH|nr:hypothetical protein [Neorhizobium huautlense]MDP9835631.1 hypothetical protein [Neorhizobium huautlense]
MNTRLAALAAVAVALSACTTASPLQLDPISARWVGQSAGKFFAAYGPQYSDVASGSSTVYNWRGGYKRIKMENGKSASVSCAATLTVSSDYNIRSIRIVADRPGSKGPSYCQELLAPAQG